MDQTSRFRPKRGVGVQAQIAHIEDWLARLAIPEASIVSAGPGGTSSGGGGSPSPPPLGRIPESQVIFDAVAGHQHEGTESHLIAYLWGYPVPQPAAGDDGKVLQWVNGSLAYQWAGGATLSKSILSGWSRADISATGTVDTQMNRVSTKALAGATLSLELPYPATVYGISLTLDGDVGGVGTQYDVTLYKNGVATAMAASLPGNASPGQFFASHTDPVGVAFTVTDTLDVYDKRTGAVSAVASEVLLVLQMA